eukprot:scaffold88852_cov71-Phaeocystis_antarctica.AAC.3
MAERSWKVQKASAHMLPGSGTRSSRSASLRLQFQRRRHHPAKREHTRAHLVSLIIVHVGVGQRCRARDEESPASLPTMNTRNVPAGRCTMGHDAMWSVRSAEPSMRMPPPYIE